MLALMQKFVREKKVVKDKCSQCFSVSCSSIVCGIGKICIRQCKSEALEYSFSTVYVTYAIRAFRRLMVPALDAETLVAWQNETR